MTEINKKENEICRVCSCARMQPRKCRFGEMSKAGIFACEFLMSKLFRQRPAWLSWSFAFGRQMTLNVNAHVQNWFVHNLNGAPDLLYILYIIWYFHIFCGDDAKRASFVKWLLCSEWLASCAACFRHISQTREIQLNIQRNAIEFSEKYK